MILKCETPDKVTPFTHVICPESLSKPQAYNI